MHLVDLRCDNQNVIYQYRQCVVVQDSDSDI